MIVNITVFSLFTYFGRDMLLTGWGKDKGFLMLRVSSDPHKNGLIQVSPLSPLLRQLNLKRVCASIIPGGAPFPLYQLQKRNHSSSDMLYRQACTSDCMDLYLECIGRPFKLEKTGDIRVSFQAQWSALCVSPALTEEVADTFCGLLRKPREAVTVLNGRIGNYTTNRTLSLNCGVVSSPPGCRPFFPTDIYPVLLTEGDCNEENFVAIRCQYRALQFKIRSEGNVPRGVLQVQYNTALVNLCPHGIDLTKVQVICRSMGYPSSDANYNYHSFGEPQRCLDINLAFARCVGDESKLADCPGYDGREKYDKINKVVNISCSTAFEGKTRVTGGFDGISGRLEIYHAGRWGTVCRNGFGQNEARVACVSITHGMMKLGTLTLSPADVAPATTVDDIWLDGVRCAAIGFSQEKFDHCSHSPWGKHTCTRNEIVYLQCSEPPVFKIAGTQNKLMVYHNGEWGGVCALYFTADVARAVCRTLGLPSKAPSWAALNYRDDSPRIWLERLICDEDSLDVNMCSGWDWGRIRLVCFGVTVSCRDPEESEVTYSLVAMNSREVGIVDMQYLGESRYFCSYNVDNSMARVACRSLRLPEDNAQLISVPDILNVKKIFVKDMSCNGLEASLLKCSFTSFGMAPSLCHRSQVLAVSCGSGQVSDKPYPLRLTGGDEQNEGTVETQVRGVWGGVCSPNSPSNVEAVVCRQLGYLPASSSYDGYGNGTGRVAWLDNVQCSGNEKRISDCIYDVGPHPPCYGRLAVKCQKDDTDRVPVGAIVGGTVGGLSVILILGPLLCIFCRRKKRDNTPIQPRAPVGRRLDGVQPSRVERPHNQQVPTHIPSAPPWRDDASDSPAPPYVIPLIASRPQSTDLGLPPSYDELFPNGEPKPEVEEFEA